MRRYKEVTKKELEKFISTYPNELIENVTQICEPPLKTFNDFTMGKVWPESVVAKIQLCSAYRKLEADKYFIEET